MKSSSEPTTIDEYIAAFPKYVQSLLAQVRKTIRSAAPEADETISYRIPTFRLQGNLIHFAAFQRHIGLYPGAAAIVEFQQEISGYKSAKGSIQFPLDQPMPLDLIRRITEFRVSQNLISKPRRTAQKATRK